RSILSHYKQSLHTPLLSLSSVSPLLNKFTLLFFFNDTATTEIYTLSLHDALPIFGGTVILNEQQTGATGATVNALHVIVTGVAEDRKSTRLNSSHVEISYAVFCLKKKKKKNK